MREDVLIWTGQIVISLEAGASLLYETYSSKMDAISNNWILLAPISFRNLLKPLPHVVSFRVSKVHC